MALTRFVGGQLRAFTMGAQSPAVQRAGESARAFVGLRKGESPVAEHDAVPVGVRRRHRREHFGDVEFHIEFHWLSSDQPLGRTRRPRYTKLQPTWHESNIRQSSF